MMRTINTVELVNRAVHEDVLLYINEHEVSNNDTQRTRIIITTISWRKLLIYLTKVLCTR